ncbi:MULTISPECIES: InlB B-repeat-containing protein [unclassified Breznakia]|uniref:InlB B-repeat-containing protein n=1 Tax=unclassified Breznakia TaxID=2623764 RepID=UPI0024743772|nr:MULTISPECIES: InlB B-repeat-containing protein [unclassified Breznakia]MDH6367500.1 hypothetical protein [Breznakia sp. PH1-1]MDH6404620.1 hypothetical protein [Breznakia sp. PF1-11]MDH6412329.1 hypothetical protein [Breznakia sp. PFB1-11]MDH6414667.1 hypothetical protein [Breznakia sp. PFB1-14]MDH6416938.1 hypothetical protein [Breznakia sp. PFB1-4]
MKKIISVALAVVIAFAAIFTVEQQSIRASADVIKTSDYSASSVFNYRSVSGGIEITSLNKSWYISVAGSESTLKDVELTIPDEINGSKVVSIGSFAFARNGSVPGWTGSYMPYTITKTDMTQPTKLTTINSSAFNAQYQMTSLEMSDSVTTLQTKALHQTGLKQITLSDNITFIGELALGSIGAVEYIKVNGKTITSAITLPSKLVTIGNNAFSFQMIQDGSSVFFAIPSTVTSVGNEAFKINTISPFKSVQIISETVGASYTSTSFNISGTSSSAVANSMVVFSNKSEFDRVNALSGTDANLKKQFTYEVELQAQDTNGTVLSSEKKLYNQSLQYTKNTTTSFWEVNTAYTLPSLDGVTLSAGYQAKWLYKDTAKKVETTDILSGTYLDAAGVVALTPGVYPIEPVIKPTVNGQIVDAIGTGNITYDLNVQLQNGNQKVGVDVYHPLLLSESGSLTGGYVEFEYYWIDIQTVAMGGSCFLTNGTRNYDYTDGFSKLTKINEIKIRSEQDLRSFRQVTQTCSGDEFYRVAIRGTYYDGSGAKEVFYNAGTGSIGGNTVGNTTNTHFDLMVYDQVVVADITYDLNGGNIAGSEADVKWTQVTDYETLGDYETAMNPTPDYKQVIREGYRLVGWEDKAYGAIIYPKAMDKQPIVGNKTYTAVWEKNGTATVIFNYDGGIDDNDEKITIVSGEPNETYTVPSVTKEGYEFIGWNVEPTKKFGDAGSTTIYTAQWKRLSYNVTFKQGDNGTLSNKKGDTASTVSEKVKISDTVTFVPGVTANTNYEFVGWKHAGTGKIYSNEAIEKYNVTEDVTFTAVYKEINNATVIFNYNGGLDDDSKFMKTINGKPGTAYATPVPTRTGYEFDGWNETPTLVFGEANSISIYHAQWTPISYKVTFEKGEHGVLTNEANDTVDTVETRVVYKEKITFVPSVTSDASYKFVGWSKDGSEILYTSDEVNDLKVTGNVVFTAIYEEIGEVTVIFDYKGGVDDNLEYMSVIVGKPGTAYISPSIIKDGYTFAGWDKQPTLVFGSAGSTSVYTAIWETSSLEVTFLPGEYGDMFDADDAKIDTYAEDVKYQDTVTYVPEIKVYEGHTFKGWSLNGSSTLYASEDIAKMKITKNSEFVAQYEEVDNATVIFMYDGGVDSQGAFGSYVEGKPGKAYEVPEVTKKGFAFTGWDVEPTKVFGKAGSTTVYTATWSADELLVVFEQGEQGILVDASGNTTNTMNEQVVFGNQVSYVPSVKSNENYEHIGWSMNGSSSVYSSEDIAKMNMEESTTFTAVYRKIDVCNSLPNEGGNTPDKPSANLPSKDSKPNGSANSNQTPNSKPSIETGDTSSASKLLLTLFMAAVSVALLIRNKVRSLYKTEN